MVNPATTWPAAYTEEQKLRRTRRDHPAVKGTVSLQMSSPGDVVANGKAIALNGMPTIPGSFGVRKNGGSPEVSEHAADVFNGCNPRPADTEKVIELYGTLQAPLRAYLGTFGLSADEVDDVIQEVFVRLVRHLSESENGARKRQAWDENHRGWLFRVAHNFVMDIYRNSPRQRDVELLLLDRADPALDPEQTILRKEKLARLDTAILRLNVEQRNCLLLRAKGLQHKEIGIELGISARRAAKLLQQGLDLLAGELGARDRTIDPQMQPELRMKRDTELQRESIPNTARGFLETHWTASDLEVADKDLDGRS